MDDSTLYFRNVFYHHRRSSLYGRITRIELISVNLVFCSGLKPFTITEHVKRVVTLCVCGVGCWDGWDPVCLATPTRRLCKRRHA